MSKKYDNVYSKKFNYFNVYVIKGKNGDILIDTGFICMKKRLKKWLDQFNIKLIILTHVHVDHAWNVAYLKKIYNCEIAIGELDLNNINNKNINTKPLSKKFNTWTKLMTWGMNRFVQEEYKPDYLLKDKQIIDKYGLKLKIILLSGHTTGSIGIKYKDYLFAGDALVNRGKKVTIAFQNQDNEKAKESVKYILNENPKIVFIGHDKEITNEKLLYSFENNTK
jgi:glyoxylase-like metal-dependent hydrolase (beta-lactamase superfamily II)